MGGCGGKVAVGVDICSGSGSSPISVGISGSRDTSGSTSGSGSAFFAFVDRAVLVRFDLVVFGLPPAPFLLPFPVAVEAVDMTDIVLVSIDSSRSGISIILGASENMVVFDWVDNRVEAFDVRDAFEARPFFAFGLFAGAVDPAKWKNGQLGDLR